MTSITRSTGQPVIHGGVILGMAGGGYQGCTPELDAVVVQAAGCLAVTYACDVEIRYNSDRESGGAWLVTGNRARVGICASLVTASHRAREEADAVRCEAEARTGRASWQRDPMTARQRKGARECARLSREWLAGNPEGQLTITAHIDAVATGDHGRELSRLPGWNARMASMSGYHHGEAADVAEALARCREYAPEG